jgi:hypothetical protein
MWIGMLMALALCVGAVFAPVTAFAATEKDATPPTLTAELDGESVKIQAGDEGSGLEAVFIDSKRVATLVNGAATVALRDYHGNNKEVAVYAVDYAGNRSTTVKFANPLYTAPVALPPASSPSPAPGSSSQAAPPASSSGSAAPASGSSSQSTPAASSQSQSDSTSGSDTQSSSPATDSQPTVSVIPDGSDAFTPEGSGEVMDTATGESKDFYSITTPDGYIYYLVIDHAREGDNVYFLNAVTEADLMALAGTATMPGGSAIPDTQADSEPDTPEPGAEPDVPAREGGGFGTAIFVILAVAAVGGAGWYFKIYKPKQQAGMDDEEDFGGEEDGEDWQSGEDYPADEYARDAEDAYQSGDGSEYDSEEDEHI